MDSGSLKPPCPEVRMIFDVLLPGMYCSKLDLIDQFMDFEKLFLRLQFGRVDNLTYLDESRCTTNVGYSIQNTTAISLSTIQDKSFDAW